MNMSTKGKGVISMKMKFNIEESFGQDGGIGRNPSLPHTSKRRITTNLKSINNQKRQKIKLHGTPTTKELKKKSTRTTRLVRQRPLGLTQKSHSQQLRGGADCQAQWAAQWGLT